MKRFIFISFCLALSVNSFAGHETSWGKVVEIWAGYGGGMVLFRLDIPHEDPKPCGKDTFYSINPENADSGKFLSVLLAAKATGDSVKLMLSEVDCHYGYPTALRIDVK